MSVAGTYNCTTQTPMGAQQGTFTVVPGPDGETFTGTMEGQLGSLEAQDGRIDGNTLTWTMKLTKPMPISLKCHAVVEGDRLIGHLDTGMMGKLALTGTRQG